MTKILLVEDDKGLREIYGVRLLAEGYDIISAGDGEEALAMAIKDRPSLIISDVMMPKISGFDMLDILRSTTETRDIKVIMMTALSSEEQRQRGESLGADRYLVKSQVGIEDVVRTVHDILGDKPSGTPQVATQANPNSYATASPMPQPSVQPTSTVPPRSAAPQPPTMQPAVEQPAPAPVPSAFVAPAPVPGHKPQTLSDRVIQPLNDVSSSTNNSLSDMMAAELSSHAQAQQPVVPPPPAPPLAPQPSATPVTTATAPQPQSSSTPLAAAPAPQPAPASTPPAAPPLDSMQTFEETPRPPVAPPQA
jgi:CheY-like chemotaxis protein